MSRKASKKWHELLLQISDALAICKRPQTLPNSAKTFKYVGYLLLQKRQINKCIMEYIEEYQQVWFLFFSYCGFTPQIQYL